MRTRFIVEVVPFHKPKKRSALHRFERLADVDIAALRQCWQDKIVVHRVDKIDRKSGSIETTELVS